MGTTESQLEMIHEPLGGNVGIDCLVMTNLADPYVFYGVNNEGATTVFGSFMQIEVVPKKFVDSIIAGEDNGSSVIRDYWLDEGMCGRGKHIVVLCFVGSFGG